MGKLIPIINLRRSSDRGCLRREPLNEAHDSTFGILENYHCWRFHGSGVIAALQIIDLIFFGTGIHHEYFFEVVNVLSCSPFKFENTENIQLIDG